jgi:hypothetical protein
MNPFSDPSMDEMTAAGMTMMKLFQSEGANCLKASM